MKRDEPHKITAPLRLELTYMGMPDALALSTPTCKLCGAYYAGEYELAAIFHPGESPLGPIALARIRLCVTHAEELVAKHGGY